MKNHLLLCLLALMGAQAQAQDPYDSWFPRKYQFTRLSDYCTYTGPNETATYEYDSQGRKVAEIRELEYASGPSIHRTTWKYDDAGRKVSETMEQYDEYSGSWSWYLTNEWAYLDSGLLESAHAAQLYGWYQDQTTRYAYQWDGDGLVGYEIWASYDGAEEYKAGYSLYPCADGQTGPETLEAYGSDGSLSFKATDIAWDRYDDPLVRLSISTSELDPLLSGPNRIAGYSCVLPNAGRKVRVDYLDENYSYERTDTDAEGRILKYDYNWVSPEMTSRRGYSYYYNANLGDSGSAFELEADELGYQVTTDYKLYRCANASAELCGSQWLDRWELEIFSAYRRELEFNGQGLLSGYTEYVMAEDGSYQPACRVEWSDFADPKSPGSVEAVATDAASVQYYNLQGRRLTNPQPGSTCIVVETAPNGVRSSRKVAF